MSGSAANLVAKITVDGLPAAESMFGRLEQRYSTMAGQQRRLEQDLNAAARSYEAGAVSAERYAQVSDAISRRMEGLTANSNEASQSMQRLAAASETAAAAQARINQVTGVGAGTDYAARAADITAYAAEMDRLQAKYDPLFAATKRYEAALEEISRAEAVGVLGIKQATAAREEAAASLDVVRTKLDALSAANSEAVQAAQRLAAANEAAAAAQARINQVTGVGAGSDYDARAADLTAYGAELDRLQAKFDPLFAATKRYEAALDEIARAEVVGAVGTKQATAARDEAAASLDAVRTKLAALSAANSEAAQAAQRLTAANEAAAAAQARINQVTGVGPGANYDARAADMAAYGVEMDRLRAKYDPLFAASKRYETTLDEIARAEAVGALGTKQAAAAREQAAASLRGFDAASERTGNAATQAGMRVQNFGRQFGDFGVQVASGQSYLTALAQQLPQLLDSFGPAGAIAGAVIALGAAGLAIMGVKSAAQQLQDALDASDKGWDSATSRADKFTSVLKAQGDGYLSAAAAGQRYREGLRGEIESIVNLTRYYGGLTEAMRSAEQARLDRESAASAKSATTIRSRLTDGFDTQFSGMGSGLEVGGDGALVSYEKQISAAATALRDFRAAGIITTDSVGQLIAGMREGALLSGSMGEGFRVMRNQLLDLLPEVQRYEDGLKRLGIQQTLLSGQAVPGAALEEARTLAAQIGGRYQTRETIGDNTTRLRAGLAEATDPKDIARITSALQEQRMALLGMEPATAGYLRGLRQQAQVSDYTAGADREVASALLALNEAARSSTGGQASLTAQMEVRALVMRRLQNELGSVLDQSDREVQGLRLIAEGYSQSAAAGEAAEIQVRARAEALKYGGPFSAEAAAAERKLAAAYKDVAAGQRDINDSKARLGQKNELELIREETRLVSASADQRERELAAFRERQKIMGEKGDPDSEGGQARIMGARQLADERRNLGLMQDSIEEFGRIGERVFDRLGDSLVDGFINGRKEAVDFGNVAKGVLASVAADAAKLAFINPLRNSLLGGNLPTFGSIGTALTSGAAGDGSGRDYLSMGRNAFGLLNGGSSTFSGIDSWAASTMPGTFSGYNGAGSAAAQAGLVGADPNAVAGLTGANPALFGTASGTVMGVGGVLAGGYGIYSGLQRGGLGGYTQSAAGAAGVVGGLGTLASAGGSIGTMLGGASGLLAAAGPYAAAAAAVLAIASAFLPGQKPSDRTGTYAMDLVSGAGTEGGLGGKRFDQDNRDAARTIAQSIADIGATLRTATGASTTPYSYEVSVGSRDGIGLLSDGVNRDYARDEAGQQKLIRDAVAGMLASMSGSFSEQVASVVKASGDDLNKVLSNLDWYNTVYKPVTDTVPVVSAFEQSITSLKATQAEAITKATELGLATDVLAKKQAEAIAAAIAQRDDQYAATSNTLRGRLLTAQGDEIGGALIAFDMAADQQRAALKAELESQAATGEAYLTQWQRLEDTLWTERRNIAERGADSLLQTELSALQRLQQEAGSLTSFLNQEAVSGAGVSPQQAFAAAQQQYEAAVAAAERGGDLSAYTTAASTLLQANSAFNATGQEAKSVRDMVLSRTNNLGASLNLPGFSANLEAGLARVMATANKATDDLRQEIGLLREQLRTMRLEVAT